MGGELDERAIFEGGPVVVFKWRNAAGWPVEYVSSNAGEVFGHDAAAFVRGDVPYASLICPEDVERVGREVAAASASDVRSFIHEPYRVRRKDGRVLWLYDYTHVLRDAEGRATHYLGYVIDITSRVEAEEQARELERRLLHAQKLESLGVLAGGVAHDFNNLLTGILGHARVARHALAEGSSPAIEQIEQIEQLAKRAGDLTRQLLAYSGRGSFVVEPVDLGEVVREIVAMLGVAMPRGARLELDLGAELPPVDADRTQMHQIVMNLLTNAGEALDGREGLVTLRTRVEECSPERLREVHGEERRAGGRYVVLEVEDTGSGMDEGVLCRLFDPFFTTKGAGRGLGMSAVQGIVRAHRGFLQVASSPGRGTTFTIFFPVGGAAKQPAAAPPTAAADTRSGAILIVDDEAAIRATLSLLLEDIGYRVMTAAGGDEALRLVEAHPGAIAAVLLDLTMPGMSGRETLAALRVRAPAVPVILTSGFGDSESATAQGASAFVQKPFEIELMERTIARVIAARA